MAITGRIIFGYLVSIWVVLIPVSANAECFDDFLDKDFIDVEFIDLTSTSKIYDYEVKVLASINYTDKKGDNYEVESIQITQDEPAVNTKLMLVEEDGNSVSAKFWITKKSLDQIGVTAHYLFIENERPKCLGTVVRATKLSHYYEQQKKKQK